MLILVGDAVRAADAALFHLVNTGLASPGLDGPMIVVTMLGLGIVQSAVSLLLTFVGLLVERVDIRRAGYAGLIAFAASGIGVSVAKLLWKRPRPLLLLFEVRFPDGPLYTQSFPSGHTTTAFAVAVAISHYLPRWRWLIIGLAVATGFSRVYLGLHYPLDVTYGAILGSLLGAWSARRVPQLKNPQPQAEVPAQ